MADDDLTGPWVLALGTLAIGVAAVASEVLRRRRGAGDGGTRGGRDDERESTERGRRDDRGKTDERAGSP
jgi:hypothetical protein